jgi:hypothetical protein
VRRLLPAQRISPPRERPHRFGASPGGYNTSICC